MGSLPTRGCIRCKLPSHFLVARVTSREQNSNCGQAEDFKQQLDSHLRRLGSFSTSAEKLVKPHPYNSMVLNDVSAPRLGSSVSVRLSATDKTVSPCEQNPTVTACDLTQVVEAPKQSPVMHRRTLNPETGLMLERLLRCSHSCFRLVSLVSDGGRCWRPLPLHASFWRAVSWPMESGSDIRQLPARPKSVSACSERDCAWMCICWRHSSVDPRLPLRADY